MSVFSIPGTCFCCDCIRSTAEVCGATDPPCIQGAVLAGFVAGLEAYPRLTKGKLPLCEECIVWLRVASGMTPDGKVLPKGPYR